MNRQLPPQGAHLDDQGVRYRIWAPKCRRLDVEIYGVQGGIARTIAMDREADGAFTGVDPQGAAGDLYKYRLDGGPSFPDPTSRWQPMGIHGPSMVIDPGRYAWQDAGWRRSALRDLSIYELHIGAFTPEGTFRAAMERLPDLRALGVTAIEIMPIADFPGGRNWGYDGVCLYAPSRAYGHPNDLRALVDAAHGQGLTVILDVVYNHFGPDGNYLGCYIGEYLDETRKTPWGGAIRYGSPEYLPLREFVAENPGYWMREFHIDGFRLDATHAIVDESPRHILQEITAKIHALGGFAIAEDSRNESRVLLSESEGGLGFDGVWADDYHHVLRVTHTGENESYLGDFRGGLEEVIDTLGHGWHYRGKFSPGKKGRRGTESRHLALEKFIHCISNHDQIGNRAFGDRFSDVVHRDAYLAASALLCLGPYTPLLFMGQEWAASTPFLFFTDHPRELGEAVKLGRRDEFRDFKAFRDPEVLQRIPDPQAEQTFRNSKLAWDEAESDNKRFVKTLYTACLALRHSEPAFRPASRNAVQAEALPCGLGALRLADAAGDWLMLFDLIGEHSGSLQQHTICAPITGRQWKTQLSTNESRFGGSGATLISLPELAADFSIPALVVLRENI